MRSGIIAVLLFISCTSNHADKWPSSDITYSIDAIHLKGVNVIKANEVIHRAFKAWEVGGIKFRHVMHGQIKVSIKPLDGLQAGFGYFPPDGRLILDSSDRIWSESLLYRVTLHEISHCLGLMHSNNPDSMTYYKITANDKLSIWDKERITKLYLTIQE